MDDVIFSEDSQIFKIQYLRNYAIKMHRVNAKKFQKFFPNDLFYKINNDSDFIAPLKFFSINVCVIEISTAQRSLRCRFYRFLQCSCSVPRSGVKRLPRSGGVPRKVYVIKYVRS